MSSFQRNERLICLKLGAWGPGEEYSVSWGDSQRLDHGNLYPKSNEKAMNHFQQRSEQTCIGEGLLCQQNGEWTKGGDENGGRKTT